MRRDLRSLTKDAAATVMGHLVMAARVMDDDVERAKAHADAAVRIAPRAASVREARALVAYREGDWSTALTEFRTVRRLSGSHHVVPYLVDIERGLGRPERALDLALNADTEQLTTAERVELVIVVSGIRRDLGQPEAAVQVLRIPELKHSTPASWSGRLAYAYAEALQAVGREDEAQQWMERAAQWDTEGLTDAAERVAGTDDLQFFEVEELAGDESEASTDALEAGVGVAEGTPSNETSEPDTAATRSELSTRQDADHSPSAEPGEAGPGDRDSAAPTMGDGNANTQEETTSDPDQVAPTSTSPSSQAMNESEPSPPDSGSHPLQDTEKPADQEPPAS